MQELIDTFDQLEDTIKQGGGLTRIEKEHKKGKMTARERVQFLIDNDSTFDEIGLWAAYDMYEEEGGCPSAGVVTGIGKISGKYCMVVANDATVKAGAWFPMSAKKNLRVNQIGENVACYSGLYIIPNSYLPLSRVIKILKNHKDLLNYVKILSKYKSGGYYTFSSKDMQKYINYNLQEEKNG